MCEYKDRSWLYQKYIIERQSMNERADRLAVAAAEEVK